MLREKGQLGTAGRERREGSGLKVYGLWFMLGLRAYVLGFGIRIHDHGSGTLLKF